MIPHFQIVSLHDIFVCKFTFIAAIIKSKSYVVKFLNKKNYNFYRLDFI